jgi:hypothetical protein
MVDFWRRIMQDDSVPDPQPPEPLSAERIDAGYRLYWTKTAFGWDDARRQQIAARVAAVIDGPDFEHNALQRRFRVEGLDEQAHSGASLVALAAVLRALDAYDSEHD